MTSPLLQFTNRCIAKIIRADEAQLAEAVQQYESGAIALTTRLPASILA